MLINKIVYTICAPAPASSSGTCHAAGVPQQPACIPFCNAAVGEQRRRPVFLSSVGVSKLRAGFAVLGGRQHLLELPLVLHTASGATAHDWNGAMASVCMGENHCQKQHPNRRLAWEVTSVDWEGGGHKHSATSRLASPLDTVAENGKR